MVIKMNMKKILTTVAFIMPFALLSCSLDNFDAPDAAISGGFYDDVTGELILQDIVNGTKIKYEEYGYSNPEQQNMVVKNDGTYRNSKIFSGTYDFYFEESNFIPPVRLIGYEIHKGENTLDFHVQPYIRITGALIRKEGNKIVARFNVSPTTSNYQVKEVGLFAHSDYAVGADLSTVRTKANVNAVIEDSQSYTLEINLDDNSDNLKPGKSYYFRVGALIDAAGAKYNYAKTVKITI